MNTTRKSVALLISSAVVLLVILAFYVRPGASVDAVAVLKTAGMTCSSCSARITTSLASLPGVVSSQVDIAGGRVFVGYDSKTVTPEVLAAKIGDAGFASSVERVLTPAQFKQATGREIGGRSAPASGCCGGKGGCNPKGNS
jgi:copper chaperone CopZ